jgi:arsenate reductase-like glutaredoxin family protein
MAENPPPREEAIRLMAENPNLIKRPIIVERGRMVLGFNEDEIKELL